MEETDRKNLNPRQLKTDSVKKTAEKGKQKEKEEKEVGGRKTWVLLILVVTVILGLIFSLQAGRLQFSAPSVSGGLNLPEFNLDLFGSKVYQF